MKTPDPNVFQQCVQQHCKPASAAETGGGEAWCFAPGPRDWAAQQEVWSLTSWSAV